MTKTVYVFSDYFVIHQLILHTVSTLLYYPAITLVSDRPVDRIPVF